MGILTDKGYLPRQVKHILQRAAGLLLAQDCLLCGAGSGDTLLCRSCADDLPRLPHPCCPRCALPSSAGSDGSLPCGHCLARPPHYDRTLAAFNYGFPLDRLVQALKYAHRLAVADHFGSILAGLAVHAEADLIAPLPLHDERLRERGFNQALELARPVARATGLPLETEVVQRIRATPAQAGLPWKERIGNVRGAFHCTRDLSGRRVLLVDDVMTTGATLDECARTLKLHGAEKVTLLVVARTLP